MVIRCSDGAGKGHIKSQRGDMWTNYSIKYTNFSVLVILLKYLEVSSHMLEMEHMLGLKKGKIRECAESDRES